MSSYCKVATRIPGQNSILTYSVPDEMKVEIGELIEVPLGKRASKGIIVAHGLKYEDLSEEEKAFNLKPIIDKLDKNFNLSQKELELFQWMSKYYHYSLGLLVYDCLPKLLKRPRESNPKIGKGEALPFELTKKQCEVRDSLISRIGNGFSRALIHGITGSGKTAIYLSLIKKTLSRGESALFLIPEINLTPQLTSTFENYLDCPIYTYHSGVNSSAKYMMWKSLKEAPVPCLIIGVRSSVFLPSNNLGLVIVDEEHDQSFKQNDRCPYNGRDVAIKKAQINNCPVILGSATPSLENYYNFKYKNSQDYFELKQRIGSARLPDVEIIDGRQKEKEDFYNDNWPFSIESINEIRQAFENNEQVLIYVNRLGFSNYIQCRSCGYKFTDPNTDTALRYFKSKNMLVSSHSDYKIPLPEMCPECSNIALLQKGFGTEKVQEVLHNLFPGKKIERFDRDEIKTTNDLEKRLNDFHSGNIDVLVGTQMISKGHNFEKVNLVIVLGLDSQLSFPDFRAIELGNQQLVQVSGRAGRYGGKSKVLIQSFAPEIKLFQYVKSHSFNDYFEYELEMRKICELPPFNYLSCLYFTSRFRQKVMEDSNKTANLLKSLINHNKYSVTLMGPTPTFIEKKANQFTWCLSLKGDNRNEIHNVLSYFEKNASLTAGTSYKIDVDPLQIL